MSDVLRLPDTALASDAERIVAGIVSAPVLAHSRRAYLLGRAYGARRGLAFDDEGLYLAALFHDAGLFAPWADGSRAFTQGSSRAMRAFLEERGDGHRAGALTDAIDFHMQLRPRWEKGDVAGLLQVGAWMDVTFLRRWSIAKEAREVARAFPRAGIDLEFPRRLVGSMRSVAACAGLLRPPRA